MGEIREKVTKFFSDSSIRWLQKDFGEVLTWLAIVIGHGLAWLFTAFGLNYAVGAIRSFSLRPEDVFAWLLTNLATVYTVALGTAGLIYLVRLAWSRWANRVKEHRARVAIGLHTYFDPATDGPKASWKYCLDELDRLNPTELNILGVTGWNTFADEDSPLHGFIDSVAGDLKILLLSPTK